MINNRQNGRRRGRGGQRPQGNPGRPDGGGNRIDSRARGNAQQLHEKYKNLARDSQMAGDRVTTEYYLQFADHYFRVLSESRARFEDQRRQREDGDEEYEGEEGEFEARENAPRRDDRNSNNNNDRNNYRRDEERRPRQSEQSAETEGFEQQDAAGGEVRAEESQRRTRRPRRPEVAEQPETVEADRLPPAIAIDNDPGEELPAPRRRGRRPRTETANDTVEVPPAA